MRRPTALLAAGAALALLLAACGGDDAGNGTSGTGGTASGDISEERCTANQEAGRITFLTSFDYAAAASIIDVVAAEEQGYFDDLCLDVQLQAGFSSANVATVAAGAAQMTSLGSFSEVAVANSKGAGLVAIAVEGHTSIEELLVENSAAITSLKQLEGRSIGIKGAIPYSLRALLAAEGVDETKITQIEVDFNPVVLFETDIVGLPVYKSNEPGQLDAQGYQGKYTSFDPADRDIPASFAVYTTSKAFADDHPTAVADFLRAALRGFEYAAANPEAAVTATLKRTDPNLFLSEQGEMFRWTTELRLVRESTPPGQAVGALDRTALEAELDALVELGVIAEGSVDVDASIDERFMDEITRDGELIWTD